VATVPVGNSQCALAERSTQPLMSWWRATGCAAFCPLPERCGPERWRLVRLSAWADLMIEPTEREVLVRQLIWEADGVLGVIFEDAQGGALPRWEPGAHIDVVLDQGLVRHYSLCGEPADATWYRIGVLRELAGRGGSAFLHTSLRPGDRIRIRGPRNHFPLEPSRGYLFIAGGIGITRSCP
jgi:hypothetical protein